MLNRLPLGAAVLSLAACGGGQSGLGPQTPVSVAPPAAAVVEAQSQTAAVVEAQSQTAVIAEAQSQGAITIWSENWPPYFRFDQTVHIGGGVIETVMPVGAPVSPYFHIPPVATRHDDTQVWHEKVRNGTSHSRLAAYLEADANANGGRLRRFGDTPPVIRAAEGTSEEHWDRLRGVIGLLNDSLPLDWRLLTSPDRVPVPAANEQPKDGEIVVIFSPYDAWPASVRAGNCENKVGCSWYWRNGSEILQGNVWIDYEDKEKASLRRIILHEIIHTLGRDHPDPYEFLESVMVPGKRENTGFRLSQLDRDALFAVYDRLEPGTRANAIYAELGPWEDVSEVLYGLLPIDGGNIRFGAVHRNGFTQPWANGPYPLRWLENNDTLFGSASWSGRLLGFTPQAEPVAGAAVLTVQLDALDGPRPHGSMDFTDLEQWAAGVSIGPIGTGEMWGDGDLHYSMEVSANSFWRIRDDEHPGDDGLVRGSFVGVAHEGMVGTLVRDDLNAAFGGTRD